jgi:hypothetical protein
MSACRSGEVFGEEADDATVCTVPFKLLRSTVLHPLAYPF